MKFKNRNIERGTQNKYIHDIFHKANMINIELTDYKET